jgi:hypothetical protein
VRLSRRPQSWQRACPGGEDIQQQLADLAYDVDVILIGRVGRVVTRS